jgi:hypothetical protein
MPPPPATTPEPAGGGMPAGIGEVLEATGSLETAAPLPELRPAGNMGRSPAGSGRALAARVLAEGAGGALPAPMRCTGKAEAAAAAQAAAAMRRTKACMCGLLELVPPQGAGGLVASWLDRAQRKSLCRRITL